jgi:hypothetical protein
MLDTKKMDAEIAEFEREVGHSGRYLADIVSHDVRSAGDPGRVIESAEFYGDSRRLARFLQLKYLRMVLTQARSDSELATAVLSRMDTLQDYKSKPQGEVDECQDIGC